MASILCGAHALVCRDIDLCPRPGRQSYCGQQGRQGTVSLTFDIGPVVLICLRSGISTPGAHCRGSGICGENGLPLRRDVSEDGRWRAKSIPGRCRTYRRKPRASRRLQA